MFKVVNIILYKTLLLKNVIGILGKALYKAISFYSYICYLNRELFQNYFTLDYKSVNYNGAYKNMYIIKYNNYLLQISLFV